MSAALAQRPPTRQQALLPAPRVSRRRRRHGEKALDPVKSRGFVVAADYEAFGRAHEYVPRSTAAPSIEINLRFPGQYLDRETGLHYNWHRYYSPELGRYLTPDPMVQRGVTRGVFFDHVLDQLEEMGDGNVAAELVRLIDAGELPEVYSYAGSSPLSFVDLDGLQKTATDAVRRRKSHPATPCANQFAKCLAKKSKALPTPCNTPSRRRAFKKAMNDCYYDKAVPCLIDTRWPVYKPKGEF